jgi:YebC/PmpR family DNA-binding regulatory protein
MSGHSHWATIRRKKGAADAKKGAVFTRLAREILMAAKDGGGDASMNFRLALAVDRARAANMPKASIDRAIKRGTGDAKDGTVMEQVFYEGYAANGVAVMVECYTENRNRTVAEIRHILSRSGGSMAEAGAVGWQFRKSAYFSFPAAGLDPDHIFEIALEAGADDIQNDGEIVEITAPVEQFKIITEQLRKENIHPEEAGLRMIPSQETELETDKALAVMKTIEALEELDDVQNVFHNLKLTDEAIAALEAE